MLDPIVMRGWLGWGNVRGPLDTYGPGGRWHVTPEQDGEPAVQGDALADALKREGALEGMHLIVVAVDRHFDPETITDIENDLAERLGTEPIRDIT